MFTRLWRGDIPLWQSFWLFGGGGGLLLVLPIFAGMLALTDVPDDATATAFLVALGLLTLYMTWAFTGIWRAANKHGGDATTALLAKVAVIAGTSLALLLVVAVVFPGAP